jgi:hypothetical protein
MQPADSMLIGAQTHRICQSVTTNQWIRRSDGIRVSSKGERELPSPQRLTIVSALGNAVGGLSALVQHIVSSITHQNDRLGIQIINSLTFTACLSSPSGAVEENVHSGRSRSWPFS